MKIFFITIFIAMAGLVNGQTVIVNPDGTHTIVVGGELPGTPKIIVHPNGQTSVVQTTGATTVVVGPDGRLRILVGTDQPGTPKILVNPDGTHSVIYSTDTHSIMVSPDGRHTVAIHQLSSLFQANIFLHLIGI